MDQEKAAESLRKQAFKCRKEHPKEALDLLFSAIRQYPDSLAVRNLICGDALHLAEENQLWDEAITACQLSQKIRGVYAEYYRIEEKACRLNKDGRALDALEVRLERDKKPPVHYQGNSRDWVPSYTTLRYYGDQFVLLNAHDRAWRLYNEAVVCAARMKMSPHTIRQSMAKILLLENKPEQAVVMVVTGICEAETFQQGGAPNSLLADLKRVLKASGVKEPEFPAELFSICETKGLQVALESVRLKIGTGQPVSY